MDVPRLSLFSVLLSWICLFCSLQSAIKRYGGQGYTELTSLPSVSLYSGLAAAKTVKQIHGNQQNRRLAGTALELDQAIQLTRGRKSSAEEN